jgi:hypothetical protein
MGTNEGEKSGVREKYFLLGLLEQTRQDKNLLYPHDEPDKPIKEGPLSYVLLESPLASVSTVSRGHPSLVSLLVSQLTPHLSNI